MNELELFRHVRHEIFDRIKSRVRASEPDVYWRFTNNERELELARIGALRPSLNLPALVREDGVSVYDSPTYGSFGYAFGYRVRGDVVGIGCDGEPVLDPRSIRLVDERLLTAAEILRHASRIAELKIQAIEELGWTEAHYDAALRGIEFLPTREYNALYRELGHGDA